jgi:hypothetical protein
MVVSGLMYIVQCHSIFQILQHFSVYYVYYDKKFNRTVYYNLGNKSF